MTDPPVWRFGVFELDAANGELFRQGRRVHLAAQPSKVLLCLIEAGGRIVTRDELRARIWGESHFVEFDKGLNVCIACIRQALGDSARTPRFVETIPRRGYRFLADARIENPDNAGGTTPADEARQARPGAIALVRAASLIAAGFLLLPQLPALMKPHTRTTANRAAMKAFDAASAETERGVDGRKRSIRLFREATELDPRFAEAHFALADTYLTLAGGADIPVRAALREARTEADVALALEDVPPTRQLRGMIRLVDDWDWAGARGDLTAAVHAAPRWDAALVSYARFLSAAADSAGALETIDRAETLNPSCDLLLWESAQIRYRAGRDGEALDKLQLAERFGPPRVMSAQAWRGMVSWTRLLVHAHQQDWTAAGRDVDALKQLNGGEPASLSSVGGRDAVIAYISRSAEQMASRPVVEHPVAVASAFAAVGRDESAMLWLERAVAGHDLELLFMIRNAEFDHLRSGQGFQRLFANVKRSPSSARLLSPLGNRWLAESSGLILN